MSIFFLLLPLVFASPQGGRPTDEQVRTAQRKSEESRQQAMHLNDLASHIQSEADAREYLDTVARIFKDELPPAWMTAGVRQRVAHAEYESVKDSRLVPEQRIADVWNEYVREIGAPDEARVTVAEIHNLRDGIFASGQMLWSQDINRSVWTVPNAVAVGTDGKVANGCRALEAVRVMFEMSNLFDNVRSAREREEKGILLSNEIKHGQNKPAKSRSELVVRVMTDTNPVRSAERRYIAEHGSARFDFLLARLFDQLFPE